MVDYIDPPLITRSKIATIAITKSACIRLPPKGEINAPNIQRIIKITAIK